MDQQSSTKENPLVLMAQACNNIGKELTSLSSSSSSKQRKINSTMEGKKSLKRTHPTHFNSSPPTKKTFICQPSISVFDSFISPNFNPTLNLSSFSNTTNSFNYSPFSPMFPQSSYLPFIYNWFNSMYSDQLTEKSFPFFEPSSMEKLSN